MNIKIDWPAVIVAIILAVTMLVFPFANPCQTEDGAVCTWHADIQGNGQGESFTNFYGLIIR